MTPLYSNNLPHSFHTSARKNKEPTQLAGDKVLRKYLIITSTDAEKMI
jgi:hypothetical protein